LEIPATYLHRWIAFNADDYGKKISIRKGLLMRKGRAISNPVLLFDN
jgi:hypothetical protein